MIAVPLALITAVLILLIHNQGLYRLAASIEEALDSFRGGGGSPPHPLPSNDSLLLNRKRFRKNSLE